MLLVTTLKRSTPSLRYLSLLGNPSCPDQLTTDDVDESDYQLYRYFIIHHLPGLRFLDHKPVSRKEFYESQRNLHRDITFHQESTPLPTQKPKALAENNVPSKGRQGKRKHRYVGKNSEGNRFIQDTDL